MIQFALRNLKIYFRDRIGVFFSFFSVLITILLYLLFLGRVWTSGVGAYPGGKNLMYSWLFAGIITMSTVTTSLGAYGSIVRDRDMKINKDFMAAPVRRVHVVTGYALSGLIVSLLVALVALTVSLLCLNGFGVRPFTFVQILGLAGAIVLLSLTSSSMVLLAVSPLKTISSFGTVSSIIGTLVGFLAGVYIPLGNLSGSVQLLAKLFPMTHGAALLRQLMMAHTIQDTFGNAPDAVRDAFLRAMGIKIAMGSVELTIPVTVVILAVMSLVFLAVAIPVLFRKNK